MDAALDPLNQIELPRPALYLPYTESSETAGAQKRQRRKQPALPRAAQDAMPAFVIGIMFMLRWYMIHSEPAITISTITAAKA